MEIAPSELARLTFGKGTANTAIRWLPFFLPTLTIAFDASTTTLALLLGIAEAAGLVTLVLGRWLDAGHERLVMIIALVFVVTSSALAMVGSVWSFAGAAVLLGTAGALITVAGHAWIAARVPFNRRARFIGVYEVSWASALLVGVPLIAVLISNFGWRGPFIAIAIVAVVAAVLIALIDDRAAVTNRPAPSKVRKPITPEAWLIIAAAATTSVAGLTTVVVAGTWLDDALGVSTGGVGLVAMSFGVAELVASTSSSAFADRLGKSKTMIASMSGVLIGLAIIMSTGSSLALGTVGLLVFFVSFEYSIVTSFSLVSEAMPEARGNALSVGYATSTLARSIGVGAAGFLYDNFDIAGPATLSMLAGATSLVLLVVITRRRPDLA